MIGRKDEQTIAKLQRDWPRHVTLEIKGVRGLPNSETVRTFAKTLSVAPLTYLVSPAATPLCAWTERF